MVNNCLYLQAAAVEAAAVDNLPTFGTISRLVRQATIIKIRMVLQMVSTSLQFTARIGKEQVIKGDLAPEYHMHLEELVRSNLGEAVISHLYLWALIWRCK